MVSNQNITFDLKSEYWVCLRVRVWPGLKWLGLKKKWVRKLSVSSVLNQVLIKVKDFYFKILNQNEESSMIVATIFKTGELMIYCDTADSADSFVKIPCPIQLLFNKRIVCWNIEIFWKWWKQNKRDEW